MLVIVILLFLLFASQPQTIPEKPLTLQQLAAANTTHDPLEQKAIEFVLKAHPELWNYTVVSISHSINRGNQTYAENLRDYLLELKSDNLTILAMVTLSDLPKEEFVSVSPLVTRNSQNGILGDFYISRRIPSAPPLPPAAITNSSISSDLFRGNQKRQPPGGYLPFPNLQDPLLQFSKDYVASLHPNIVNYFLEEAEYQIVAGVNIKLEYVGLDKFSSIEAVVGFNLDLKPELLEFAVNCVDKNENDCSREIAWDLFYCIEGVILVHPELMEYRIVNLILESTRPLRAMVTFENKTLGLRSLTEVAVDANKSTILSFFTYQYLPSSDI